MGGTHVTHPICLVLYNFIVHKSQLEALTSDRNQELVRS